MSWTEDRVELLKRYWGQGKSASQIAALLGDVTRNAVIGKAHRLGLSGRPSPIRNRPALTTRPKTAQPRRLRPAGTPRPTQNTAMAPVRKVEPAAATAPAEPPPPPVNGKGVTILELNDRMCKWPIGDPRKPGFRFCGHAVQPGTSYCAYHAAQAYQKPAPKGAQKSEGGQGFNAAMRPRMVAGRGF